jgi:hypothetical protein
MNYRDIFYSRIDYRAIQIEIRSMFPTHVGMNRSPAVSISGIIVSEMFFKKDNKDRILAEFSKSEIEELTKGRDLF